jgi:hypothetical protein
MHVLWAQFLSRTFLIRFSILLACIPTGNFYADKKFLDFMTKEKKLYGKFLDFVTKEKKIVWTVKICIPCTMPQQSW